MGRCYVKLARPARGRVLHDVSNDDTVGNLAGTTSGKHREIAAGISSREDLGVGGYKVLDAPGPQEALSMAESYREPIHLLLTDVVMPKMSGPGLAQNLTQFHPESKVIFMSGYTDDGVVRSGVLEPGTYFLHKPFTGDHLIQMVQVLDQSGQLGWKARRRALEASVQQSALGR